MMYMSYMMQIMFYNSTIFNKLFYTVIATTADGNLQHGMGPGLHGGSRHAVRKELD